MEIDINELLAKAEANQNEKLAHAGVPGMKWGVRRWQNEDGSYTPEGRIHYGLNPKYADKSSEDMRKEIEYKRTRDSYIANRTAETRKKRDDLTGLGKSIVKFGANSVNAGYTVKKNLNERNDKQLDRETALNTGLIAEYNTKAKDTSLSDAERAEYADQGVTLVNRNKEIEGIKGEHAKFKEEAKATEKEVKSINSLVDKSDIIEGAASLKTKRQLEREVAEASEAADEMSYEEMKKLVDRMNLEKQYDDMVNPKQPSKAEKLKKAVDNIDHWLALGLTVLAVEKALKERREKRAASHDAFDDSEYLEHYGVKGQKWGWMKHENDDSEYLEHVGVKGMKKGVRRYQNEDGSLTAEGYRHYGIDPNWNPQAQETPAAKEKRVRKEIEANYRTELLRAKYETKAERYRNKEVERQIKRENKITQDAQRRELQMQNEAKAQNRKDIRKNVMKALVGSAVVGMFVAKGIHSMRMDALMTKNNHELNMLQETGRQEIEKLGISSKSQEKIASINAGKEKYASKQERLAKTAASNATIGVEKEKRKSEIGVEKAKQSGALNVEKAKQEGALNVEKEKQAGAISVEKAKQSGALNVEKEKQAGALDVAKTNADKEKYAADQELKSKVGFRARKLEKIKQEGSLNVEKEKQAGAVSVEKEKQSGALNVAKENAQKEIEINKATNASNLERDNAKHGHEKETNAANRTHELERDRLKNEHEAAMEKAKREHQDATNEANRAHELERDKRAKDHENETNAANRAHELERDRQKNDFELARDKAKASSELKQLKEKNRSNLEIEKEKGMQRALKDDPRQVVEKLTEEKDEAVKKITKEKDEAVKKIIKEKDSAVKEKDNAVKEKDNAVKEKDNAVAELERMRTYVQSLLARGNK